MRGRCRKGEEYSVAGCRKRNALSCREVRSCRRTCMRLSIGISFCRAEKKRHATSKFLFAECARGWSLESCEPISRFLRFCLCLRQPTFQSLFEPASTNTIAITTSTTTTISRYCCTLPLHAHRALRFLRYVCNEPQ